MVAKEALQRISPSEPTMGEELASVGDGVAEMTNLPPSRTGIRGMLFISTVMGSHGPRVKFFVKAGGDQPSFSVSISDEPEIVASSLPERVVRQNAPDVISWVKLNKSALLQFWKEGNGWSYDDLAVFIEQLKKLS
jgi:uncharacterized protein YneR